MTKPTVCLTFDFDAISVWLGTMGLSTPTYVSRGEFAANVATPRILDLLEREGVTSTWYIPGLDADTYPDVCKRIRDAGHEIGHHGYAHEGPTSLDEAAESECWSVDSTLWIGFSESAQPDIGPLRLISPRTPHGCCPTSGSPMTAA